MPTRDNDLPLEIGTVPPQGMRAERIRLRDAARVFRSQCAQQSASVVIGQHRWLPARSTAE